MYNCEFSWYIEMLTKWKIQVDNHYQNKIHLFLSNLSDDFNIWSFFIQIIVGCGIACNEQFNSRDWPCITIISFTNWPLLIMEGGTINESIHFHDYLCYIGNFTNNINMQLFACTANLIFCVTHIGTSIVQWCTNNLKIPVWSWWTSLTNNEKSLNIDLAAHIHRINLLVEIPGNSWVGYPVCIAF